MKRAFKWLDKNFECVMLGAMLVAMTVIMMAQVVFRKALGVTLPWAEPFCCHLMIYMGLLGVSCTLAEGNAIRFDVIVAFVNEKTRLFFAIIADIVTAATFIYLTPSSFEVVSDMVEKTIAGLPYTMSLVYTICALSVVLIDLRSIEQLIKNIIAFKNYKAELSAEETKGAMSEV